MKLIFRRAFLIFISASICGYVFTQDAFEYALIKDAHRIIIPNFHSEKSVILTGLQINEDYDYTIDFTDKYLPGTSPDLFVGDSIVNGKIISFTASKKRIAFDAISSVDQCGRSLTLSISRRKKGKEQDTSGNNRLTPIQVTSGESIEYLVQDIFLGGGCFDVMNFAYQGGNISKGTFSNGTPSIEMEDGFFISTTNAGIIPGPNIDDGFSITTIGQGSDPHLQALPGVTTLWDVTTVEFDFIPKSDTVSFKYVFASEEYCEFVNSQFNDVFGFFISGPGIDGPYVNDAENIALVPGTSTEVAINTVNTQLNSVYYRDNTPAGQFQAAGDPSECIDDLLSDGVAIDYIEFDGFTAVFEASIEVIPCEEYHIKLALADVGDALWDSGVFFEANSFKAGSGIVGEIDYGGFELVYESCNSVTITFSRSDTIGFNEDLLIEFEIDPNSTATEGVDYDGLTDVIIPGGVESVTITLEVYDDNIVEGQETIILIIQNSCDCEASELEIIIDDHPPIEVFPENFFICEPGVVEISPEVSGGLDEYIYMNGATGVRTLYYQNL